MLNYPLRIHGKIELFNTEVTLSDANSASILYVQQKASAIYEDILVFRDSSQSQQLFQIKTEPVINFIANYTIMNAAGKEMGKIGGKSARVIWKAHYDLWGTDGYQIGDVNEENLWMKVFDRLTGFALFINPAYLVKVGDTVVLRLRKEPTLMKQMFIFERKFVIEKLANYPQELEDLLLNSMIMLTMLELRRKKTAPIY